MLFDPGKNGKEPIYSDEDFSFTENIVLKLVSSIKDKKRRNIFVDEYYSTINLMKKLSEMGYVTHTVLSNSSKEIPSKLKTKGYEKAYDGEILIQKSKDKKPILFATNYKIEVEKLKNLFNLKNRGFDDSERYLEIPSVQKKSTKWYKKIFIFGIESAIINAKIR